MLNSRRDLLALFKTESPIRREKSMNKLEDIHNQMLFPSTNKNGTSKNGTIIHLKSLQAYKVPLPQDLSQECHSRPTSCCSSPKQNGTKSYLSLICQHGQVPVLLPSSQIRPRLSISTTTATTVTVFWPQPLNGAPCLQFLSCPSPSSLSHPSCTSLIFKNINKNI